MLQTIAVASQIVPAGSNVLFTSNKIKTRTCGCFGNITHEEGSGLVDLNGAGLYRVDFSANVTTATTGNVVLALEVNGEPLGDSTIINYEVADISQELAIATIVRVPQGTRTLSVGNYGTADITVSNASLIVTKEA